MHAMNEPDLVDRLLTGYATAHALRNIIENGDQPSRRRVADIQKLEDALRDAIKVVSAVQSP